MADKRLIDANAFLNSWHDWLHDESDKRLFIHLVEDAPTIDAVEVVRCKDCKYAIVNENHIDKPLICCLTKMVGTTDEDWFCADGKRRMDGGAEGV